MGGQIIRAERLLPLTAWVCFLTFGPDYPNIGEAAVATLAALALWLALVAFDAHRELVCRQRLVELYLQDQLPPRLKTIARAYLAGNDVDATELYQLGSWYFEGRHR